MSNPDLEIARTLAAWIRVADGARYLDLGCGEGTTLAALREHGGTWVGLDVRRKVLAAARDRLPHGALVRAKGGRLPFRDGAFAGGVCLAGLGRFVDPVHPLAQAARVLASGARLAVRVDGVEPEELPRIFRDAGFELAEELAPGIRGASRCAG